MTSDRRHNDREQRRNDREEETYSGPICRFRGQCPWHVANSSSPTHARSTVSMLVRFWFRVLFVISECFTVSY